MTMNSEPGYRADEIAAALAGMADERQARAMQRFFKTGPGDYGEGDRFLGLTNPQVRLVVREVWRRTPLAEARRLVMDPGHEVRLCGLLIMVEKYLQALKAIARGAAGRETPGTPTPADALSEIHDTYLSLHPYVNNWDLVDLSAIKIAGNHEARQLAGGCAGPTVMDRWIEPGHTLWQQRIAMVSTWMLTRRGMPEVAFRRAARLLDSPHPLLHKAAGWMLRETWKRGHRDALRDFLRAHATGMPATMLSYACEQMAPDERRRWQRLRREQPRPA